MNSLESRVVAVGPVAPVGEASRRLKRHPDTLKKMGRKGEIDYVIAASGHWRFDVEGYLARQSVR
jgi:hypothetical protein